jgi:phosphatidylinositol glycan class A protein
MQICGQYHAKELGVRVVYTDHSLFGFADAASIHINKTLKWILTDVDACITVSHTNKENLTLRASISPHKIYVIPNAVDTAKFTPDPSLIDPKDKINIVIISRLAYRKGIDLLVDIIPPIVKKYPNVYFIIGGDGPKKFILEEVRDNYNLHNKMEFLGRVPHNKVRDVLCRGHIFLNTSLTEAFCIAILEAASCGLLCVSTNVGGVPEVLPPDMVFLASANPIPLI